LENVFTREVDAVLDGFMRGQSCPLISLRAKRIPKKESDTLRGGGGSGWRAAADRRIVNPGDISVCLSAGTPAPGIRHLPATNLVTPIRLFCLS
jgi:hypothetical protein